MLKELKSIGISNPATYVVNELGCLHIYLCFGEAFEGNELFPIVDNWLRLKGLDSSVSLKRAGEPLELPLQNNFSWIDEELNPVIRREDISTESAIALFLSDLNRGLLELDLFIISIAYVDTLDFSEDLTGQSSQNVIDFSPEPGKPSESMVSENKQSVQTVTRQEIETFEPLKNTPNASEPEYTKEEGTKSIGFLPPPGATSFQQLMLPLDIQIPIKKEGRAPP